MERLVQWEDMNDGEAARQLSAGTCRIFDELYWIVLVNDEDD